MAEEVTTHTEKQERYAWASSKLIAGSGLDLFCGDGTGTELLRRLPGRTVMGVDGDQAAIERARSDFGGEFLRLAWPHPWFRNPAAWDFIVALNTIELVEDGEVVQLLVDLATSIRVGGQLILAAPKTVLSLEQLQGLGSAQVTGGYEITLELLDHGSTATHWLTSSTRME